MSDYLDGKLHLEPKALFLLFLSDISNDQENISKSKDTLTIVDRYVFSTIAYKIEGISYYDAKQIVETVGYLVPDKVILLDLPATVAVERKKAQKEPDRYESNPGYLKDVRERFLHLAEEQFLTPNWVVIDADRTPEEIHRGLVSALKE
jgi:thymidylate kinase